MSYAQKQTEQQFYGFISSVLVEHYLRALPLPLHCGCCSIYQLEVAICVLVMSLVEGTDESRKLHRVLQQFEPTLRKLFERSDLWVSLSR